jgi:hypothetical protein
MNKVGTAAAMLKARLDMIYDGQSDEDGRSLSSLHDTLLPMSSKTLSVFGQLRSNGTKKGKKSKRPAAEDASSDAAGRVPGKIHGSITGVDMHHLLLLLPFLLFDLMNQEINACNERNNSHPINPANQLIRLVLLLLEWYHLYR